MAVSFYRLTITESLYKYKIKKQTIFKYVFRYRIQTWPLIDPQTGIIRSCVSCKWIWCRGYAESRLIASEICVYKRCITDKLKPVHYVGSISSADFDSLLKYKGKVRENPGLFGGCKPKPMKPEFNYRVMM